MKFDMAGSILVLQQVMPKMGLSQLRDKNAMHTARTCCQLNLTWSLVILVKLVHCIVWFSGSLPAAYLTDL